MCSIYYILSYKTDSGHYDAIEKVETGECHSPLHKQNPRRRVLNPNPWSKEV